MPSRRVSISVARKKRRAALSVATERGEFASATLAICAPPTPLFAFLLPSTQTEGIYDRAALSSRALQSCKSARDLQSTAEPVRQQPFTEPGFTPAQTLSLLIQPVSITSPRLALVIGSGGSRMVFISTPFLPLLNFITPGISVIFLPSAMAIAASAAVLPSTRL